MTLNRVLLTLGILAFSACACAQPYPVRPITLLVPYTPGTGIDIIARVVGPKLAERWGQPVVVENKPGASGNIGAGLGAKAPADGYTMIVTVNTFTITPALFASLPYDPVKDFAVTGEVARGNLALVSHPSLQVKNLQQLAAAAKAQKLSYASPGNGTPQHLAMEVLKQRLGMDILHVPYKGSAQAVADLLGGQVQLMVLPVHTALPQAKSGKLNLIGVSGEKRSPLAPDAPSFAELGVQNLDIDLYYWIAGPAGLPREIVQKWNREVAAVLSLPEVRDALLKQGMVPVSGTPEEAERTIANDIGRWKKFIAQTGIKAD